MVEAATRRSVGQPGPYWVGIWEVLGMMLEYRKLTRHARSLGKISVIR